MLRLLLILTLTCAQFLMAGIEEKISQTQTELKTRQIQQKEVSQRLRQLSREIDTQNSKLMQLSSKISTTKKRIATLKKSLNIKSSKLKKMEKLYRELKSREEEVNRKLIDILSQQITISMLQEGGGEHAENAFDQSSDDLVFQEVLTTYGKLLRTKFADTKKRFEKLQKNRKLIQDQLKKISSRLDRLKEEQQKLAHLQLLQKRTIENLQKKKRRYKRRLAKIIHEQKNLSSVLQKLHITKKEREQTRIRTTDTNVKVRRLGSSYQKGAVSHYKGPKTIAPLKSYTVVQRFGSFVDPVYKIKIFNQAIKLKPKRGQTMVRNVLPGKVVYANKAPMLGNVVIMEHRGNIHTIYANLNKLAPRLRVGTKLKAGNVIGRVADTLTFEVTKDEKHINPTELFD